MATINQINANRQNAKKSTGAKTQAGKDRTRFNALTHGLRAESVILPGEEQSKFDEHLERLSNAWSPQDDMEKSLVEQIAVNQWKLARLDRAEARLHADPELDSAAFVMAIHRMYLTQSRLERSISSTIADLQRYRQEHAARVKEIAHDAKAEFSGGLIWESSRGATFDVLPQVKGLDGIWREIPREVMGDFPKPQPPAGETAPKPNGHA